MALMMIFKVRKCISNPPGGGPSVSIQMCVHFFIKLMRIIKRRTHSIRQIWQG